MADIIPIQPPPLAGTLHVYVAFDWGDEIDLERVHKLAPASPQELARRRRTPTSFTYRPAPLQITLPRSELDVGSLGKVQAQASVTIFDFAAVSVALRVPWSLLARDLVQLAASLTDSGPLVQQARALLLPTYQRLLPAIKDPLWLDDLSEEYFVFQLPPEALAFTTDQPWLAGVVHLETEPLSAEETAEALRNRLSYGPDDLFVTDWAAAVLVDRDCEETLQAIEFANLQLLEFRNIDNRLDASLDAARRLVQPMRHWLPWHGHDRPLRALGELKVEANGLFERTGNALKLIGDPYLARVHRLVARRFHLETWMESIQRKLDVAEGVYQVVADQASHFRAEFLEITVVVLILIEIVLAIVRH